MAINTDGRTQRLLNFGCGQVFHPDWINVDSAPVSPQVLSHDLTNPFPFADESFDAVYGSHVVEHLEPGAAQELLAECFRVLKPGGIVRIVVPDLEPIARLYLASLENVMTGDREAEDRYDWSMLELYDQVVRKASGGQMAAYIEKAQESGRSRFVTERIGWGEGQTGRKDVPAFSFPARIARRLRRIADMSREKAALACAFVLLGSRGASALRDGLFRSQGEIHQWMYDRFSLARSLARNGFSEVQVRSAGDSDIRGFAAYQLEVVDERERKPDSLYVEGRRPAQS